MDLTKKTYLNSNYKAMLLSGHSPAILNGDQPIPVLKDYLCTEFMVADKKMNMGIFNAAKPIKAGWLFLRQPFERGKRCGTLRVAIFYQS